MGIKSLVLGIGICAATYIYCNSDRSFIADVQSAYNIGKSKLETVMNKLNQESNSKENPNPAIDNPVVKYNPFKFLDGIIQTDPNYQRPVDTSEDPLYKRDFWQYRREHGMHR